MGGLVDWIRRVIVIVIIVSFVEMLLPEGTLRKFSRLVMGLVVILAVISPLIQLVESTPYLPALGSGVNNEVEDIVKRGQNMAREGQELMWREMQQRTNAQVGSLLELMDGVEGAQVVTQIDSAGNLENIIVKVRAKGSFSREDEDTQSTPHTLRSEIAVVEPVEIHVGDRVQTRDTSAGPTEEHCLISKVESFLASFYGLAPEKIRVSFVE